MGVQWVPEATGTLHRLWAETTPDIVVETDRAGFIRDAAGRALVADGLFGAHLLDLIHPASAGAAMAAHRAALREGRSERCDVRMLARGRARWCELGARALPGGGAVAVVLRPIDERRRLEQRLFTAAMTDALTGLTNRHAFTAMLGHLTQARAAGCLAIFAIDHFKAVNLKYGYAVGDELLVVVADFLRTLFRREDILSRIGGECFAVLLPELDAEQAAGACGRVIATLAELGQATGTQDLAVTLSGGLVALGTSSGEALRAAELALTLARAKGRNRLERDRGPAALPRLHR